MWVRKTPAELEADARRWRLSPVYWLITAAMLGLGVMLAVMSPAVMGGSGYSPPRPLSEAWRIGLVVFIFFALTGYTAQLIVGGRPPSYAFICTACFTVHDGFVERCSCGGSVEPLTKWRWRPPDAEHDITSEA
jgi:hypothetical protein